MPYRFEKHYTREEAKALLPQIRLWLREARELRGELEKLQARVSSLSTDGRDAGGEAVNQMVKAISALNRIQREFSSRQIQIKDIDRGLVDFPALIGEREVFLCWEEDEEDVEFWHDIDSGYAGREPL